MRTRTVERNDTRQPDSPHPSTLQPESAQRRSVGPPSADAHRRMGEIIDRWRTVTPRMATGANDIGVVMAGGRMRSDPAWYLSGGERRYLAVAD